MGKSIAEKDAEIERLKLMCAEFDRRLEDAEAAIQRQDNVIIEKDALLTRAADTLDRATKMLRTDSESKLIAELRKAAQ